MRRNLVSCENSGFSLLEVLIAIGILCFFVCMSMAFLDSLNRSSGKSRTIASKERISSGIRNVAGMPAALRNSIRAALPDGMTPINEALNNCVAGTVANACKNDQEYPLTLFSPTLAMDSAGSPLGLLPITAPPGSAKPKRFDSFGIPCSDEAPAQDCIFNIYTSFRAQCPPSNLPAAPPPPTDPNFLLLIKPMDTCTIAESVTVFYSVEADPNADAASLALAGFSGPVVGSITTPAKPVFGNDPQ